MPIAKEFTVRQEDKPGTLGKLCHALADKNINILAFQSFPISERPEFDSSRFGQSHSGQSGPRSTTR